METLHFSHPHPLKPIPYQQTLNLTSPCPACKLKPSAGILYTCTVCKDYFLHKKCSDMPQKIDHFCHKKPLTLLPKPASTNGRFVCNACGKSGDGFSYNGIDVDLHMLCALMPLSVAHESHVHMLSLIFESSYPFKSYSCGICNAPGSTRHWLYRCKLCEFNAHLDCATAVVPKKDTSLNIGFDNQSPCKTPPEAAAAILSRLAPSAPQLPPIQMRQKNVTMPRDPLMMNINDVAYGFSLGVPVSPSFHEVNRKLDNDLALLTVQKMIVNRSNAIAQAVQQMIVNNSEAIAQGILISGGRGYGGGEKEGLHLLTDLICVLTNAGGSGGGGQDSVNNGGGGGGAGGAGAGGGTDYVPSFPGDGKAWY
ncbi:hypothetical protein ABFS82_02G125000 [Erythranthe guttata]|uniref:uncharacterized protein LOC105969402 n=1 Tax=Erythranthe guttata TaxID=4155 RepID=UPI00064DC6BF|nr:PREDICTED: uncharacterized protein LOC105969402 [Erythranthe guttata]|eukprot:XP_012849608.1 PREDICTED: uncharacterized protein LOC105969402 [Erythranthe guttata]